MLLVLVALTSRALIYFNQLAAQYPSLPATATADQFAQCSKGYAHHLVLAGHTVYSAVFLMSMVLCLIAIVPAIFLWGSKTPVEVVDASEGDTAGGTSHDPADPTLPVPATADAPAPPDPADPDDGSV